MMMKGIMESAGDLMCTETAFRTEGTEAPAKTYVVIDVEMCRVPGRIRLQEFPHTNEIIQIGAVMMNEAYERIAEFSSFVRPDYGKISGFIRNLTGITEQDVRHAPSLEQTLRAMLGWIGNRDVIFCAWSETDYTQIRDEIEAKGLDREAFALFLEERRWIDYQKIAGERFGAEKPVSLTNAIRAAQLRPEGQAHDGLTDAWNTARLIEKLERNPDMQFSLDCLEEEDEYIPLGFSLGNMLGGLQLEIA